MGSIVKCPQCGEINIGSKLYCVKCQTSLVGIPREQGESPLPEFTSTQKSTDGENYNVFKNIDRKKIITGGVYGSIYVLSFVIISIKPILQHAETFQIPGVSLVTFIGGLILYLTPAEIFLRIDRSTGYHLSKLGPFEDSGFERASRYYESVGRLFMIISIAMNVGSLLLK